MRPSSLSLTKDCLVSYGVRRDLLLWYQRQATLFNILHPFLRLEYAVSQLKAPWRLRIICVSKSLEHFPGLGYRPAIVYKPKPSSVLNPSFCGLFDWEYIDCKFSSCKLVNTKAPSLVGRQVQFSNTSMADKLIPILFRGLTLLRYHIVVKIHLSFDDSRPWPVHTVKHSTKVFVYYCCGHTLLVVVDRRYFASLVLRTISQYC